MTAETKKHKVNRALSILRSSSYFRYSSRMLMLFTLVFFEVPKERFYEAAIRISNLNWHRPIERGIEKRG